LLLAKRLIQDLDKAKPEVVIDVAVLEVSRDLLRNIGVQLPQTASINFQPSNANLSSTGTTTGTTSTTTSSTSTTTSSITLNNLAHLNSTNFAVTIGQAAVNLLLTDTRSRIIQNPQIRASDGQEATMKIGERIPIATGSYQTGAATAIVSSLVNTQFQYIDVGVNMDMKPTVHYDRDVSMKFKIEVSATNGNSNIGGITEPIITQRIIDQTIRLKDGEPNLLGGIVQHQTTYAISGTPGLAELPLLKYFFSTQQKEVTDDEIVFLVVPHVVRGQEIDPENLQQIDTGTTNNIELRPVNLTQIVPQITPPATQATVTSAPAFSGQQTFPGQQSGQQPTPAPPSAATAAQQAMANMQQQANPGAPVNLTLSPPQSTQKVGSTFRMVVDLSGGNDVFGVPLNLQYDASKLTLINVDSDDPQHANVLGKDGQSVALVHRDDGKGNAAIAASRPPGTKGISGSGTLCVLTFQANAPGDASVAITRPVVRNSQQQPMQATGSQAVVHIQ
jgi:general secretion pathway protein D